MGFYIDNIFLSSYIEYYNNSGFIHHFCLSVVIVGQRRHLGEVSIVATVIKWFPLVLTTWKKQHFQWAKFDPILVYFRIEMLVTHPYLSIKKKYQASMLTSECGLFDLQGYGMEPYISVNSFNMKLTVLEVKYSSKNFTGIKAAMHDSEPSTHCALPLISSSLPVISHS